MGKHSAWKLIPLLAGMALFVGACITQPIRTQDEAAQVQTPPAATTAPPAAKQLEAEEPALKEKIERLEETIARLEKSLKDQEEKLKEMSAKPAEETPAEEKTATAPVTRRGTMEELYPEARTLALKGDYPAAADIFFYLTEAYPDHELAPDANYWLGECYYGQKEFGKAIQAFQKVASQFPGSTKAPAALLKSAYAFSMLDQGNEAMLNLKRLLETYPESREATLVKEGKTIFRP